MQQRRFRLQLLLLTLLQWHKSTVIPFANGFPTKPQRRLFGGIHSISSTASITLTDRRNDQRNLSIRLAPQDDDNDDNEIENPSHPLAKTSRLSHVMLKVPSVDDTVKYWTDKGGIVCISREKEASANGASKLASAFVELGYHKHKANHDNNNDNGNERSNEKSSTPPPPPPSFKLELISTDKQQHRTGNSISYIGVSLLLQFKDDLLGPFRGEKPQSEGTEPNGIPVKSSASAPGDYLSRFALKSKDLIATHSFYSSILGMETVAVDSSMLCLRYENESSSSSSSSSGVPTTLVFDVTDEQIDRGNCFDHLAIVTTMDIDQLYDRVATEDCRIFMKPTEMFGKRLLGVLDPNGYRVIIASD